MNKVFFILLFPLNMLAQQFPSDLWHPGLLVTNDGDTIKGDINSYGMKYVTYNGGTSGKVWVEDFLESSSAAWDEINDHCN